MIGPSTSAATLTSSTPRDQRLRRLAAATVLAFLAALIIVTCIAAYAPVDQGFRTTASNVTTVLSAFAAAAVCLCASQAVRSGRERVGWLILALGFASNFAAEALWTYFVMVAGIEVPFPSVADVFYLAFYPLALVGILLLVQTPASRTVRALTVMDSLLFTLGVSGLLWQLLIVPSLSGEDDLVTTVVALAYPVGDFLVIFALCSLFLATELRTVRMAATLLLASFLCTVVADLGFAYLTLNDAFADGSPIDPLWTIGYALAAVAALQRLGEAREETTRKVNDEQARVESTASAKWTETHIQAVARLMVPYVAVPAALIMIMVALLGGDDIVLSPGSLAVVGFSLGLLGLVMVRQFLTLFENVRLSRSYEALSRDLEQRVQERTRELTTLNHTAAVLSRCLRTRDVLESGLSLALNAAGARAGAVWLRRADGLEFAAHELDAAVVDQLDELARDRLATAERATSTRPAVLESRDDPAARRRPQGRARRRGPGPLRAAAVARGGGRHPRPRAPRPRPSRRFAGAARGVAGRADRRRRRERAPVRGGAVHGRARLGHRHPQPSGPPATPGAGVPARRTRGRRLRTGHDGPRRLQALQRHLWAPRRRRGAAAGGRAAHLHGPRVRRRRPLRRRRVPGPPARHGRARRRRLCRQRLRKGLAERPFTTADGARIPLQLSFGVAELPRRREASNELIALADASLYRSKQRGGDQITRPANTQTKTPTWRAADVRRPGQPRHSR